MAAVIVIEGGEGVEKFLWGGEADKEVGELIEILGEGEGLGLVGGEELREVGFLEA